MKFKKIAPLALAITPFFTVFYGAAFSGNVVNANAEQTKTLTIGTTPGDFADLVKEGLGPELEKQGYKVKLVEFTDFVTPNLALAEGQLDANIFQHKPYLEHFAQEKKLQLKAIAPVPTAPLGLYSGKLKSLDQIKEGSTIAVPNDPTNLSRALDILTDLGWIGKEISQNPKHLKIVYLEAAQIPRVRADVDYAVINGNYAVNAGIDLTSALIQEKNNLYINWVVTTDKNSNEKFSITLQKILNSDPFKKYAKAKFKGYKFPISWSK